MIWFPVYLRPWLRICRIWPDCRILSDRFKLWLIPDQMPPPGPWRRSEDYIFGVKRLRPTRRRRAKVARPAFVRVRLKKPKRRFRTRLEGW